MGVPRTSNDTKLHGLKSRSTQKDADVKIFKLLNETCSLFNIMISELIIIYIY